MHGKGDGGVCEIPSRCSPQLSAVRIDTRAADRQAHSQFGGLGGVEGLKDLLGTHGRPGAGTPRRYWVALHQPAHRSMRVCNRGAYRLNSQFPSDMGRSTPLLQGFANRLEQQFIAKGFA
jgi:hypothetical protein